MIARISAKIVEVASSSVVVEVSGIGYEVVLPQDLLLTVKIGDSKNFHIAENIKKDENIPFYDRVGLSDLVDICNFAALNQKNSP